MAKKRAKHSDEFKRDAVRMMRNRGSRSVTQVADDLGVHRFAADVFYGGGRWPLLTAFHGMARLAIGDEAGARADLDWIAATATDEGLLPEQVSDRLIVPDALPRWTERWGAVATPLLWSHGEYLRLWDALGRP